MYSPILTGQSLDERFKWGLGRVLIKKAGKSNALRLNPDIHKNKQLAPIEIEFVMCNIFRICIKRRTRRKRQRVTEISPETEKKWLTDRAWRWENAHVNI